MDSANSNKIEPIRIAMRMHVIYKYPKDYPDDYAVREHFITAGGKMFTSLVSYRHKTLEDARASVQEGRFCVPRHPDDDPVIVESWV